MIDRSDILERQNKSGKKTFVSVGLASSNLATTPQVKLLFVHRDSLGKASWFKPKRQCVNSAAEALVLIAIGLVCVYA